MKLGVLKDSSTVAVTENGFVRLSKLGFIGSISDLIGKDNSTIKKLSSAVNEIREFEEIDYKNFDAPLKHPSKIPAIGLNYIDHAAESKMEVPKTPIVFTKFPNSITGPRDAIKIPIRLTQKVDYEVELAVIIGKGGKNISKEEALNYVFGYTIVNDVSARDLQFADGQWVRGKSLDTFCPMGPIIVTIDEIKDPQNLKLVCEVNGEKLQNDSTKNMIFSVADLISILSQAFTLERGDIIATGTPSGVGFSRKPPIYLKDGDIVKTWIEGIGELVNPVIEI
ncbi:MAG: FAA hydrolase family protein [Ignavibacteriales bacterium]|nr:MAG: FAA hydrolase family protein [Ignavibacteriales bacterium]